MGKSRRLVTVGRTVWVSCCLTTEPAFLVEPYDFWLGANFLGTRLPASGGLQPRRLDLVLYNAQATLETQVPHSRAYFQICFFRRPIFCSPRPPSSLSLCYHLRTFPHVDAIAPLIRMSTNAPP
jgi:hypothetical protein